MGPLKTRNNFPPYFMFLAPIKDSPQLLPQGQWQLSAACDYSNVFVNYVEKDWDVLIDMETTVMNVNLAYGFSRYVTLSLDLAWVDLNDGVLDDFLNRYHKTLGLPNYERETRPKNTYGYFMNYRNKDWFNAPPSGLHLIDSTVSAKVLLLKEKKGAPISLSFAYCLKVPAGDADYGLGSGRFDHGFFLLGQLNRAPFIYYFHGGYLLLDDPETIGAEIEVNSVPSIFGGLEFLFNEHVSLIAQFHYFMSPFDAPDIVQLDVGGGEFDFGAIYRLRKNVLLEFAFSEDIFGTGAPDFNFHFRTTLFFGT